MKIIFFRTEDGREFKRVEAETQEHKDTCHKCDLWGNCKRFCVYCSYCYFKEIVNPCVDCWSGDGEGGCKLTTFSKCPYGFKEGEEWQKELNGW